MPTKGKALRKRRQVIKGEHGGIRLLLTRDVADLGKAGDVVEVRPGYARNYLLPQGMATTVSEHNLRLLRRHQERVKQLREAKLADLRALAGQIGRATVTIEANANEKGHLYGSVGPVEISRAMKAMGLPVEPEALHMEGPIQELALYGVKVHLAPEIETEVKVLVIAASPDK